MLSSDVLAAETVGKLPVGSVVGPGRLPTPACLRPSIRGVQREAQHPPVLFHSTRSNGDMDGWCQGTMSMWAYRMDLGV